MHTMKYLTVFAVIIVCAGDEVLVPMGKTNDRLVVASECKDRMSSYACDYFVIKGYCKQSSYVAYMIRNCCQSCKDLDNPKPSDTRAVDVGCLESANKYRKRHQRTRILEWDKTLAQKAQTYADFLADKNRGVSINFLRKLYVEHDPDNKVVGNGENLYFHISWKPITDVEACILADKEWYDEIKDWDFQNSSKLEKALKTTGDFTQMIWNRTGRVGFGIARTPSENAIMNFVVAKYKVRGNMPGRFKENVMPLKK